MCLVRRKRFYWTKENCIIDAKKYKNRANWKKNSIGAYTAARKNGWLEECCKHMVLLWKFYNWTLNSCKEEALKYNRRIDWKLNSNSSYTNARKNGWLEECCKHMLSKEITKKLGTKKRIKWRKEICIKEAKKYKTRSELIKNNSNLYNAIIRNNWKNICFKHMIRLGNEYRRLIYAYEFSNNTVYIGLTGNPINRKKFHLSNIKSPVFKYILNNNIYPIYKELTSYIDNKKEIIKKEIYYINYYKTNKWNLLNVRKGGELGGKKIIWTKERCRIEAKKYKYKIDFIKKSQSAYVIANKNGWINEICKHMYIQKKENNYWTKERCHEIAKKCKYKYELKKKNPTVYKKLINMGWVDEICNHMKSPIKKHGYWTKERCRIEAKKYNLRSVFQRKSVSAYTAAWKNNWLDEICNY